MIKKTITYTDYNGNKCTEDFYFHFTQAEAAEMELRAEGGMSAVAEAIINAQDRDKLMDIFKKFILEAYGEKTPDGKYFRKKDNEGNPLCWKFEAHPAYSVLFMEMVTDAQAASDFFNSLVPKEQ